MRSIRFKKTFLILGGLVIGITIPTFLVGCSIKADDRKLIPYENTQESLNEIGNSLRSSDFIADTNLKLADVKIKDIQWKYVNNYPNIKLTIYSLSTRSEYKPSANSSITFKNVVLFKVALQDKNNPSIVWLKNNLYFFIAYFQ